VEDRIAEPFDEIDEAGWRAEYTLANLVDTLRLSNRVQSAHVAGVSDGCSPLRTFSHLYQKY